MGWILDTAARTLWQEARGEPLAGQIAVAHVFWNRVRKGSWGPNLATVCLWRNQFSGWMSADPNFRQVCILADDDPLLVKFRGIITNAQNEADPTNGATHYFATSMKQPPDWSKAMTFKGQIGNHKFYAEGTPITS